MPNLKLYGILGTALAFALLAGFAWFCWDKWGHWEGVAHTWEAQANRVVKELRLATDNPDADWKTAPGQIIALGESRKSLKLQIDVQNERIDELAKTAVRLQAKADELRVLADRAQAQRRAAYTKLSQEAVTPGAREDMLELINQANDALDTIREARG